MTKTTTLFLRGIPVEVVRSAKAAAALRGSTLGAVVAEALATSLSSPRRRDAELEENMAWYEKNRTRLLQRYKNQYVAIVEQTVADHDADFSALAERVFERYGYRSIFMPRVRREDRPLRIRSPRRVS